ncbi:hypothetical protein QYE76_031373 [Lolium multiflorum]|uniref:Uncharacterized protein n=1 Tax=Lolium multiflorum TaxID=4521 RepID=A0AAD8VK55_LOLMU|nr:hypothetical protein QYE76_031373 [Lolium multiflorum]
MPGSYLTRYRFDLSEHFKPPLVRSSRRSAELRSRRTCAVIPAAVKLFTASGFCGASAPLRSRAFPAGLRRFPSPVLVGGQELVFPSSDLFLVPSVASGQATLPSHRADRRGIFRNWALDKEDSDPYIHWADLKMGRIPISHPEAPSASTDPQVHEHAVPLQARSAKSSWRNSPPRDKKRNDPEPNAGPSAAPPAKRPKKPSKRHYVRREMPTSDGPALKVSKSASGMPPESSEDPARSSPPPRQSPVPSGAGNSLGGTTSAGRAAPNSPDHRAEEDLVSPPENQDIGASNTGAESEDAGPVGTLVPTAPKKKKKILASSSSKSLPETFAPAKTTTAPGAPKAASMPPPAGSAGGSDTAKPQRRRQEAVAAKNKPAPPRKAPSSASWNLSRGRQRLRPQPLVPHSRRYRGRREGYRPARPDHELKREGRELGHLLDYAEKWNQADVSAATRGVGRDRLPIVDPAGPKSTEEHFMHLKRAVREFDNAWHDATSNVVITIPEASIEALKTQLSDLHAEKEHLIRKHQEALDAQKEISRQLKDQPSRPVSA